MRIPVLLLVISAACRDWPAYDGAFDVPHAATVLQPENGGPFEEPIGFVANLHGGQIWPLALKQGRMLASAPSASFLRGNAIATGQLRLIAGLAVTTRGEAIELFVADRRFAQILQVPWSSGPDGGSPITPAPLVVGEPVFEDVDGSGDQAELVGLEGKAGWTSTESWTVEYDGASWAVTGSRSGRQRDRAVTGEPYVAIERAVAFTIEGTATAGDRFVFETDSGLVEHPAGGTPLEVRQSPDGARVAVVVEGPSGASLKLLDPADPAAFAASPSLVAGRPGRLAWSADGRRLFAADSAAGAWEVDVEAGVARWLDLPWPTFDVAPLEGEADRLWVARADRKEVHVLDLATGALLDLNPWTPGQQGMVVDSPVAGLEAMPLPYLYLQESDAGVRRFERSVAVALSSGRVVFSAEADGCLVDDGLGARTNLQNAFGTSTIDYTTSYDGEFPFGAFLERNETNGRHVLPNPCGGVTRAQTWTLTFDELRQGWRVEGSLSGVQATVAREDRRYVTDDGEISLLVRAGSSPSRDGQVITFQMIDGLTSADGDNDRDGNTREVVLDQPGDPVYFHYRVGPDDGGWRPVDERPHVLLVGQGSDSVGRIMPQEGQIDASWE